MKNLLKITYVLILLASFTSCREDEILSQETLPLILSAETDSPIVEEKDPPKDPPKDRDNWRTAKKH